MLIYVFKKNGNVFNLDYSLKFFYNYEVFNKLIINFYKYFWTVEYFFGFVNFCYFIF